ncbi:MAG: adenine/guanine phosphoribosyltransferase-like PRPP-binding protein [Porticoccus sp.]|jgi:hypothetical protein|tara:strand:- start:27 stop:134 length:108 start_codon:yes stop_codon:yes gene_type:complete
MGTIVFIDDELKTGFTATAYRGMVTNSFEVVSYDH